MDKKLLATASKKENSNKAIRKTKQETTETPWMFDRAVVSIC